MIEELHSFVDMLGADDCSWSPLAHGGYVMMLK
jgi:hypothetical protein